jgi:hypothetical protein
MPLCVDKSTAQSESGGLRLAGDDAALLAGMAYTAVMAHMGLLPVGDAAFADTDAPCRRWRQDHRQPPKRYGGPTVEAVALWQRCLDLKKPDATADMPRRYRMSGPAAAKSIRLPRNSEIR